MMAQVRHVVIEYIGATNQIEVDRIQVQESLDFLEEEAVLVKY